MAPNPWFAVWNYEFMQAVFHYLPHAPATDDFFQYLISNPLVSTCIPAAFFYVFWAKQDEQQAFRRRWLLNVLVAFTFAVLITLIVRPWIAWPAPLLNPAFQPLYPRYLWGTGSRNCFPSHSTLAYFTIAAGFWPLNRSVSVGLSALMLAVVSLPRLYVGGHYPIDVLFSCVLGVLVLGVVWRWPIPDAISSWLIESPARASLRDCVFFLWVFELGEGFRGMEFLLEAARRLAH